MGRIIGKMIDRVTYSSRIVAAVLLVCCMAVGYSSCSSDNADIDPDLINRNANDSGKGAEATLIEMPRLKSGVANMLLVKKLPNGNVNFCIEWDIAKKAQRWTAFRWDTSYKDDNIGRTEAWSEDFDIPEYYRTNQSFYSGSGYTRGHIIASEDRQQLPLESNRQTFLYSNMQPQYYNFNGGIWLELEKKVRSWNTNSLRDTLYVCKGGTIDHSSDILETTSTGLLVPKYFFVAVLCKNQSAINNGYKAIGFYLEHKQEHYSDEKNLKPYIVSIDRLEELTGLDFFCNLPDPLESQVESAGREEIVRSWGL